jgi:hypothetical protein
LCCGVGLLSSYDISGWLALVTMPTSVDGSKVCFWRLCSNSWMKSDPLSGDVQILQNQILRYVKTMCLCSWFDGLIRSQQTVSTLYQVMGFQHTFRCWLSSFVPSFIFEWRSHTFLHNLCNKASVVQLMNIFL